MKLRLLLVAPLLATGACATPETLNSLAVGICQKQEGCHVRDQAPRHGSQQQRAVEDVIEPYLLQQGFIMRTPRGRMACAKAYAHLGLPPPAQPAVGPVPGDLFE